MPCDVPEELPFDVCCQQNGRAAQETTILDELYLNGAKDAFSALDHRLLQAICGGTQIPSAFLLLSPLHSSDIFSALFRMCG